MIQEIKRKLISNYVNWRGWSTNKKIVVIESDDWGSVRVPSKEAIEKLIQVGADVRDNYFLKFDCLESNTDLEALFELLSKYKDQNGNHPSITANTLLFNPDFKKIKNEGKQQYYDEPIETTYKRYPNHDNVLKMWLNEGIPNNFLFPQFHAREHINPRFYMQAINSGNKIEDTAFDLEIVYGFRHKDNYLVKTYMATNWHENEEHKKIIHDAAVQGLDKFQSLFGFRSISFAACCSIQSDDLNEIMYKNGVEINQLGQFFEPQSNGTLRKVDRFWGDKNSAGQRYWRRNVVFEPSRNQKQDWTDTVMQQIETAFRWGKPAVINSHRVNFSGGIETQNRDLTLKHLDSILKAICKKYPEVLFLNSAQLAEELLADLKK